MNIQLFKRSNHLIPVIIQDVYKHDVLMLGYMNKRALQKTKKTGFVWFWSRSKKRLWMKGETSGNKFKVSKIFSDCDGDALLIIVKLLGSNACHDGKRSCFHRKII